MSQPAASHHRLLRDFRSHVLARGNNIARRIMKGWNSKMSNLAGLSLSWAYTLEEILGLVLVAGIVGLYSLLFAFTERNWRGWLVSACLAFAVMAWLIAASSSAQPAAASDARTTTSHPLPAPV